MIISIDGPAGSGKSTIAKLVAEKLNIIHFNSGLLYRGITAYLLSINFDIKSITTNSEIPDIKIKTTLENKVQKVFVNRKEFTSKLRDNLVSTLSPYVSSNKNIRNIIDNCQREFAKSNDLIIDGRDIGSHVFPNADYKFYLDCSVKERAKRRFAEEKNKNSTITLKEIEKQIKERDFIDKNKKIAPLVIPKGAIKINSTSLSINEVVEKVLKHINF